MAHAGTGEQGICPNVITYRSGSNTDVVRVVIFGVTLGAPTSRWTVTNDGRGVKRFHCDLIDGFRGRSLAHGTKIRSAPYPKFQASIA